MISRCTKPNNPVFASYGGRGITVCNRWMSFDNFLADMGVRPDDLSINRIDNNLGYSPENCEWADSKAQNRNKRNTIRCDDGVALVEKIDANGLDYSRVYQRVRNGVDFETAKSSENLKRRAPKPRIRPSLNDMLTGLMCGVPFSHAK